MLVGQAQATLKGDKDAKRTDTEWKVGMDSYGGLEGMGSLKVMSDKGLGQMSQDTIDNFRSAGNKLSNLVRGTPDTPSEPSGVGEAPPEPDTPDISDFTTSVNKDDPLLPTPVKPSELTGAETTADDVGSALNDAGKGEEDLTGIAKGLTAWTGEGSRFGGLSEAGSVGRFLANKAGFTSELGVEVAGKSLGAIGGGAINKIQIFDTGLQLVAWYEGEYPPGGIKWHGRTGVLESATSGRKVPFGVYMALIKLDNGNEKLIKIARSPNAFDESE